jgi:hypothetical protein
MAALRHPEILRTHDKVGRLFRLQQRRVGVRKTDRPEFIVVCMPGAEPWGPDPSVTDSIPRLRGLTPGTG